MVYICERTVARLRHHSFRCLWAANVPMLNQSLGTDPGGNHNTAHCNKRAATWCPVSESKHDLFFEDAHRIERHSKYTVFQLKQKSLRQGCPNYSDTRILGAEYFSCVLFQSEDCKLNSKWCFINKLRVNIVHICVRVFWVVSYPRISHSRLSDSWMFDVIYTRVRSAVQRETVEIAKNGGGYEDELCYPGQDV